MLNHLESLCRLCGASGQEHPVRDYLIEQIKPLGLPYQVDPLGNLIVEKKGKQTSSKKWMIGAHTDEVGLIVTYINENGTMKLAPVGGIDPSVVIGRAVQVGEQRIPGVIGAKPIHLLSKEDRKKAPSFSNLYLDIGAANRKEAEQFVQPGTYVHFRSGYTLLGGGKLVRSKALDDRIGCAILLDLLQKDVPYDFTAAFHVQEEIGLRGAKAAAYTINPDFALILETTTAADFSSAQGDAKVCQLGKGPVVSFMDRSTLYDRELYRLAFSLCEEAGISCQTKTRIAGGNDSGAVHVSRNGVRTLAISAPCRNLHSPSCVANLSDIQHCATLTALLLQQAGSLL